MDAAVDYLLDVLPASTATAVATTTATTTIAPASAAATGGKKPGSECVEDVDAVSGVPFADLKGECVRWANNAASATADVKWQCLSYDYAKGLLEQGGVSQVPA